MLYQYQLLLSAKGNESIHIYSESNGRIFIALLCPIALIRIFFVYIKKFQSFKIYGKAKINILI
jgi:hypothetical protein